MRLRIRYHRYRDLVSDWNQQLSRGGLLVRVDVHSVMAQFQSIELEIAAPRGSIVLPAQIVQVFAGVGVAVTFAPSPALEAAANNARMASDIGGGDPEHSVVDDASTERMPAADPASPSLAPKASNPIADALHRALYGTRDERSAVMRDGPPAMQQQVLRNPGLQLDEIVGIARLRTVSVELLKTIGEKREWAQRPEIALALVRNPKTPVPLAIRLLDHISPQDLRQLAKDTHTRAPIQTAARKRLIG
ncbi:MAG: hypothetical protein NVSMB47_20600 [Polyangiales bacterium]